MCRLLIYEFAVTPIFQYIMYHCEGAGLYVHCENSKETLQLFLSKESFLKKEKYIGAIQYEGSNDYHVREPHIVSFRFKRVNLPLQLREQLETISSYRKDKNSGPSMNPSAESIAFKFEQLNIHSKEVILIIFEIIRKYKEKNLTLKINKQIKVEVDSETITSLNGKIQLFLDEIKKFKELLDQGVISKEEFEVKKKQLLGL